MIVHVQDIRRLLPEFERYLQDSPEHAGTYTRKEAGYLAELLTLIALERGLHVLVDGSLRDWKWYETYFETLRQRFHQNSQRQQQTEAEAEQYLHSLQSASALTTEHEGEQQQHTHNCSSNVDQHQHRQLKIAILHIVAPKHAVFKRASVSSFMNTHFCPFSFVLCTYHFRWELQHAYGTDLRRL